MLRLFCCFLRSDYFRGPNTKLHFTWINKSSPSFWDPANHAQVIQNAHSDWWFHYTSARSLTPDLSAVLDLSSFSSSVFSFSSLWYSDRRWGSPCLAQLTVSVCSVTEQMKWKALDCLEVFFRSACSRACTAQSSKAGQNVPWTLRWFYLYTAHGYFLLGKDNSMAGRLAYGKTDFSEGLRSTMKLKPMLNSLRFGPFAQYFCCYTLQAFYMPFTVKTTADLPLKTLSETMSP